MNLRDIGNFGEDVVVNFLIKKNYKILDRNYHSKFGEIDIIACNNEVLAFVEVKTRNSRTHFLGAECVNIIKQRKILKTATLFIQNSDLNKQPRFDVAEVLIFGSIKNFKIRYIKNAFGTEENFNAFL